MATKKEKTPKSEDAVASASVTDAEVLLPEGGESAPAEGVDSSLAPRSPEAEGDFSAGDIQWPRLAFAAKTSKVVEEEKFKFLDIVLNHEVRVGSPTESCELTVIGMRKYFEENVPFEEKRFPQKWPTEAAANAAGFTTRWINNVKPDASEKLVAAVLVKCPPHAAGPAGASDFDPLVQFPLEYEGAGETDEEREKDPARGSYALCMFEMKGAMYTAAAKPLITALTSERFKRLGIQAARFKMKSAKKTHGQFTYAVAVININSINSDAFVEWAKTLL